MTIADSVLMRAERRSMFIEPTRASGRSTTASLACSRPSEAPWRRRRCRSRVRSERRHQLVQRDADLQQAAAIAGIAEVDQRLVGGGQRVGHDRDARRRVARALAQASTSARRRARSRATRPARSERAEPSSSRLARHDRGRRRGRRSLPAALVRPRRRPRARRAKLQLDPAVGELRPTTGCGPAGRAAVRQRRVPAPAVRAAKPPRSARLACAPSGCRSGRRSSLFQ